MMRKIYVILTSLCLCACETVVEVDIPQQAPRLVANAFINPDSLISVRVSQSKHVLDTAFLRLVHGAQVSIYENDQLREVLQENEQHWYVSTFRPKAGREYTLQVEAPAFKSVQATTFIQPQVPIQSLTYQTKQEEGSTMCDQDSCWTVFNTNYSFELSLQDPPAQNHYYEISGFQVSALVYEKQDDAGGVAWDTVTFRSPVSFYTEDPAVNQLAFGFEEGGFYGESLLFSDELFRGKSYTIRFDMENSIFGADQLMIQLHTIDEARYHYLHSKRIQQENAGNPFAEPINVFSNVEHGYGIFAGYSTDIIEIKVE